MTATHNIPSESSSSSVEGLPKSFVCSMRTLFDIMDDQNTGYVRFTEIERRWQEDGTQGLPEGVLSSLRKVTPSNGYLSFDRFCAGLKMCLLKNKGKDDSSVPSMLTSIQKSASLSPTSSLEAIPPLKASSPQISPQNRNRPLSAPLLDQEPLSKQLSSVNGNAYSGLTANRKLSEKTHLHNDYHSKVHLNSHSHSSMNSKIYSTKPDIRMGVGGIKPAGNCPSNNCQMSSSSSSSSSGPPKPPRSQDNLSDHIVYRSRVHQNNMRMTNSLERESRSDKRWNRERESSTNGINQRKDRGGSLERLLDSGHQRGGPEHSYGPPLNRTGMRSALQSWFKERSKSDLQQSDADNNHRNIRNKRSNENYYKENRVPPGYSVAVETAYRGNGDGGDCHRSTLPSKSHAWISPPPPPPPPTINNHSRAALPKPPVSNYSGTNVHSHIDNKIYGKPLETVVAVPANFNPGPSGGGRSENGGQQPPTNGAIAHGHYVAPQPPQLAVHKKTAKKKEPRRHTLQNGVDQNVMKRLRQLEAERDMLYQGLDVVERAKVWYKMQLQGISERIHYLPFGSAKSEPSLESQQEKLHFQLARIHEINAHLRALMDAHDKGLPTHMNLAIRGTFGTPEAPDSEKQRTLDRLKQQNKLLTEEVSGKSERITNLEREKAALLRELFQVRATHRPVNPDSTFM